MIRTLRPFMLPLGVLLGIILLAGAVALVAPSFLKQSPAPTVFSSSPRFLLNGGVPRWYALEGGQAILAPGPNGFDKSPVSVLEAAPAFPDGSTPVLARANAQPGVVFGILRPDGGFSSIVADGTEKRNLAVREDGLAAFSFSTVSKNVSGVPPLAVWTIGLVDTDAAKPKVHSLGAGMSLAFADDGGLIGVTSAGIVHFEPAAWKKSVIITREDLPVGGYAVSANVSHVALSNPISHEVDLFSLDPKNPTVVSYTGSIPSTLFPFAFLNGGSVIGKSDDHTMLVYDISAKGFPLTQTVTYKKETP